MDVSFTFDDPREAADVLEFILSKDWPSANAGRPTTSRASANRTAGAGGGSASASADEQAPWEGDDEIDRSASRRAQRPAADADDDPWADSASSRSKGSGRTSGGSGGKSADTTPGKDFPESGEYEKQSKGGVQMWTFGTRNAPTCDCGHAAAQVEGYKGKDSPRGKPSWTAYWCPVGFGKSWKKKCDFSEWA